jgi:phosphogluconate dehydratase
MPLHPSLNRVTERIRARSAAARSAYLQRINNAACARPARRAVSCSNLAHTFAAAPPPDKLSIRAQRAPNIAIISAYNDMLSAHQPLATFPDLIKGAAREAGATAQFAGGVPAMCDGITQGQTGMELSLWSRDVIAQATAIALSHGVFDGALLLGVCDKIVPGMLIGALAFGALPVLFVPAGPMTSGIGNEEKAHVRQRFALGQASREELLEAEARAYHGPGTCTFYGTANSNQLLLEVMGLQLPGSAFVHPGTELRVALTAAAARRAVELARENPPRAALGHVVDERAIANAIVGLLASGGSTNHTMHLVAIAHAAGLTIDWDDFDELSAAVPLLARIYPNGEADVNRFHAAGGIGFVIRTLLDAGLLHEDVETVAGRGLRAYTREPCLADGELAWRDAPAESLDRTILRSAADPFSNNGGLRLLRGNLGRAIFKTSAVAHDRLTMTAPARVFESQAGMLAAFKRGELERDVVVVVRFQGPRANGMPELHQLTPSLATLQDKGHHVALVTDGRMSGASGTVPAAIHLSPEAAAGGPLARVRDGDPIRIDARAGVLEALVEPAEWLRRECARPHLDGHAAGAGRELFAAYRSNARSAELGAITWEAPAR